MRNIEKEKEVLDSYISMQDDMRHLITKYNVASLYPYVLPSSEDPIVYNIGEPAYPAEMERDRRERITEITNEFYKSLKKFLDFNDKSYNEYYIYDKIPGDFKDFTVKEYVDGNPDNTLITNLRFKPDYLVDDKIWPYQTITKTFEFEASHFLPYHNRRCCLKHGHCWKLEVTIKDRVKSYSGMACDFRDLKDTVEQVIDEWDHGLLNIDVIYPTSEMIVIYLWEKLTEYGLKGIESIKLHESNGSMNELTKDDMLEFSKEYKKNEI